MRATFEAKDQKDQVAIIFAADLASFYFEMLHNLVPYLKEYDMTDDYLQLVREFLVRHSCDLPPTQFLTE